MSWVVLVLVLFVGFALIGLSVVALGDVGDEPGAHRFRIRSTSEDEDNSL